MTVGTLYDIISKISEEDRALMKVNIVWVDDFPESGEYSNTGKAAIIDMTTDKNSKKQLCLFVN